MNGGDRNARVNQILDEFGVVHRAADDATIESVHVALMLEDVFGVTFDEAALAGLTDRDAIARAMADRPPRSDGDH